MLLEGKIAIIGVGRMGEALLGGILKANLTVAESVVVADADQEKLREVEGRWGVNTDPENDRAVKGADIVVLAVKPQVVSEVLDQIAHVLSPEQLIISIAAGIRTMTITERLGGDNPVVRVMPNIAAQVGEAISAVCLGEHATEVHGEIAASIFSSIGKVVFVEERLMDAVTGLSGSGLAYIYMVIEALADGGVKMGLPREIALKLATQTVLGAARMVQETRQPPAILKDQVTTPGGTTIAALHELEARGLRAMFMWAVEAATKRSQELSQALSL